MSPPVRDAAHAFAGLPLFSFDLIMADPPWPFRLWSAKGAGKSAQAHYQTMSIEEIAALPVGHLAAEKCLIVLWGTWPLLLDSGDVGRRIAGDASHSPIGRVLKNWGFRYVTGGAWTKRTKNGKASFGTGFVLRTATEPFLIGVNGAPATSRSVRNLIESVDGPAVDGLRREHSRKPDEAYEWAERLMPKARRLDLFSRQDRPGWTSFGLEAGKFNA